MKTFALFLFCLSTQAFASPELRTVDFVDPVQYVGRWYQIARNPMPFEPQICACAQQTLSLNQEGTVGVYNSCNAGSISGELADIRGIATNVSPGMNSKFKVDFGMPRKGDYWIIGLATDYSWAVVSDPSRQSLYILSKTPVLGPTQFKQAIDVAAQQVSLSKLTTTQQAGCTYPPM